MESAELAQLHERAGVDEQIEPFPDGHLPEAALTGDEVGAAHGGGPLLALPEVVQQRLPGVQVGLVGHRRCLPRGPRRARTDGRAVGRVEPLMRIAPLFALAGALVLAVSCSSKDDNGGASKVPAGVVTSSDAAGVADTSATTAAGAPSATTAPGASTAPTDPTPPTSLPSDPAAAVKAFYGLGGGTMSDPEATCVASSTGPGIVDSLNEALSGGVLDPADRQVAPEGVRLVRAPGLRRPDRLVAGGRSRAPPRTRPRACCTPWTSCSRPTTPCSPRRRATAAIAEWPMAEHDKFATAVKTCVPDDLAAKIVS